MEIRELDLSGVFEIIPRIFYDERGHFFESYNKDTFDKIGIKTQFVQDNQSFSKRGVVRGLHLQKPPFSQIKLVRVFSGTVLDVIVDCRKESKTFGKHLSIEVSAKKNNMIYIPEGFAHGFSAIDDAVFQYKCSKIYNKAAEAGIHPLDGELNIDWIVKERIFSNKDLLLPSFNEFISEF